MNKKNILISVILATSAIVFSACGNLAGPDVNVDVEKPKNAMVVSAIDDRDTETHFRAVGIGINKDLSTAKAISLADARTQLANKVETKVNAAITSSMAAKDVNGENVVTTISRDAVSKQTTERSLVAIQQYTATLHEKNEKGDFVVYVGLEVSRDIVKDAMSAGIDNVAKSDPALEAVKEQIKSQAIADLMKGGL